MYSEGAQARLQGREAKRGFAISLTLNTKENTFAVGYENFCYTKILIVLTPTNLFIFQVVNLYKKGYTEYANVKKIKVLLKLYQIIYII